MNELSRPDPDAHIAACGLFCTNCGAFRKGRCQGCQIRPRFSSCRTRACCEGRGITTCAECGDFAAPRDFRECPKVYNWIARIVAAISRSDRTGALVLLRDRGREVFLASKRASGRM